MIGLDTNLLVYAHRAGLAEHRAAIRALSEASGRAGGWAVALPTIAEFLSVTTHPANIGGPSSAEQAVAYLEALFDSGLAVLFPDDRTADRLLSLARQTKVQGKRVYDLQIALIARDNGVTEFWTHDADFIRLPGLRVVDPLQ
jgi:hypothetical protein